MPETTNPDVLRAALYRQVRESGTTNAKDEDVAQIIADDIFALSEKLESDLFKNQRKIFKNLKSD